MAVDLTPKQEAFANAYIETGNQTEAYRRAYDVAPDARDSWISVEACQLLDHPKIARRVSELKAEMAELAKFTRLRAMQELDEARTLAMTEGQSSAAIKATEVKIKMLGLDAPSRVEVAGKDGGPIRSTIDVTKLSTAALEEIANLSTDDSDAG